MADKKIVLKCGIVATKWKYLGYENIVISLIDLYNGYGKLNNILLLSQLFKELYDMGFDSGNGMSYDMGYYNSIDDLTLTVRKKSK